MLTAIIVIGVVLIGVIGIASGRSAHASSWTVAGRDFPRWTSWFLQAGESLTTFAFLGMAGLAFGSGMVAVFPIVYLTTSTVAMYFVAPRIRDLGARRGYLTMADMFCDRFNAPWLASAVAIVGSIFLIPYLALQVTGLGVIVELATGSSRARGASVTIASLIIAVFVIWSGIRGIARVAIVKDFAMLGALGVVVVAVLIKSGGPLHVFDSVATHQADLLTVTGGGLNAIFFISVVVITTIGAGTNTFPHLWPPVLAAQSGKVLRDNYKWLGIYQLVLFLPLTVGLAALSMVPVTTKGNAVLFTAAHQVLPDWLLALVAVAGASAAIVPAAAIAMGISSPLSRNVLTNLSEAVRFRLNHVIVVGALGCALVMSLTGAQLTDLLLVTYGGLSQLAPGVALGLVHKVRAHAASVGAGMLIGSLCVVWITVAKIDIGMWDSGLVSLGANVVVLVLVEGLLRALGRTPPLPSETLVSEAAAASVRLSEVRP